jgi:hypothetical protein
LKQKLPVSEWDIDFAKKNINKGKGPETMFLELVNKLSNNGARIKDLISQLDGRNFL